MIQYKADFCQWILLGGKIQFADPIKASHMQYCRPTKAIHVAELPIVGLACVIVAQPKPCMHQIPVQLLGSQPILFHACRAHSLSDPQRMAILDLGNNPRFPTPHTTTCNNRNLGKTDSGWNPRCLRPQAQSAHSNSFVTSTLFLYILLSVPAVRFNASWESSPFSYNLLSLSKSSESFDLN